MKRNEIISEFKKGVKAVKYNKKPNNPTHDHAKAKEKLAPQKPLEEAEVDESGLQYYTGVKKHGKPYMTAAAKLMRDGGNQKELGALKDRLSKAHKNKSNQDVAEGSRDRRDAYQRDYDSSVSGMGKRDSYAYSQDGGGNDERHDLDPSDWYIVRDGKMYKTSVYPRNEREAIRRGYSRTRDEANAKAKSTDEAIGADVGKITKVDPATQKATLTKPDGTSMEVDSTALKPTPDGKMSMDTPDLKTGTAVVSTEATDVPYQVKNGPQPMAMSSPRPTAIVASKKWTAITPDIEAKAHSQGFRKVMLKVNGQLVPGLEGGDQAMGSKIIVAPSDFENMTRTGDAGTARRPMGVTSAEKTGIGAPSLRESDKALLDKMLTIAGLR